MRLLWHHFLLGERLYLFAWMRYLVVLAIPAGALFATYAVGIQGLDIPGLCAAAILLALYNTLGMPFVRRWRQPEQAEANYRRLVAIAHATITLDFLVLTYCIWLVGGAESPFLAFYVLHVILGAVLLSRPAAFAHAVFGYALLAGIVVGEWREWIPRHHPAGAVPGWFAYSGQWADGSSAGAVLDHRYVLTVLVVYGLLMAVSAYLMSGIARLLRERERQLREANLQLERLANLRRAFLHIVLHDLKSPVAAVATLNQNLASGLGGPLTEQQTHWVERAHARLRELLGFLRDLQVMAELETERIEALKTTVALGPLLQKLVEEHQDLAQLRRHTLRAELTEPVPAVRGVERLLLEGVANYLTNAIKYTPEGGSITVRACTVARGDGGAPQNGAEHEAARIEVADNGPGLSPDDQARLFNEFVRLRPAAPAPSAGAASPVAAVPSTGLGLSIVRRIAELHGGRAGVVSEVGKGSTFFLEVPLVPPAAPSSLSRP